MYKKGMINFKVICGHLKKSILYLVATNDGRTP